MASTSEFALQINPSIIAVFLCMIVIGVTSGSTRAEGPIRVFVLAGQSNMVGAGSVRADPGRHDGEGSLEWLVDSSPQQAKYASLRDDDGSWRERQDVRVWFLGRTGGLRPGFGSNEGTIGPELGFGTVVGDSIDEPVILVKIAWGGKAIGKEFRPPSSGGEVGDEYRMLVENVRNFMEDPAAIFPEYEGREFALTGIGWHQGWNDRVNQAFNDAYEENLSNLIRDLRKELHDPDLPFVIAETGMSGLEEKHPRALSLMAAQAAVARRSEFRGNVAFVGTRAFYRPADRSPSSQGYHWNSNAETYFLIGEGMGTAMLELMGGE